YDETRRDDPARQWARAHLIPSADHPFRSMPQPITEAEAYRGDTEKVGLIRREPRQVAAPRAADPNPEQRERHQPAFRRCHRAEHPATGKGLSGSDRGSANSLRTLRAGPDYRLGCSCWQSYIL